MYQGIVIGAMGVSVCIGPVIGGALTQYASWRKYIPYSRCHISC